MHMTGNANSVYGRKVLDAAQGNQLIKQSLMGDKPVLAGRIGTVETQMLNVYYENPDLANAEKADPCIEKLVTNAGFFPGRHGEVLNFCKLYDTLIPQMDIFASILIQQEDFYVHRHLAGCSVVALNALEPYYFPDDPWSASLAGKKVLIVSPFSDSIENQYRKRDRIFPGSDILPVFQLETVKAVQTIGSNTGGFDSWFEALECMKQEISKKDFDIAIIGCGAYSLPLGCFIKDMKRKCVIMGGATQILFGIKGKRWDHHKTISLLYNDAWVRPAANEIPKDFQNVENGCYW